LRNRVRGDEKIELADRLSASLEISAKHSISFGRLAVKRENRDGAKKILDTNSLSC